MAEEILTKHRGKALAIVKATRAGATFSLLKRAIELEQKTVIVAPYIEIFNKTVKEVGDSFSKSKPTITRISKNEDICKKIAQKVEKNPCLRNLSFHMRPSCKTCEYNSPKECRLQEILAGDWDVLGLTYAKLRALSVSESEVAFDLLEKIRLPDNLILDEFVTGIIVSSPSVEIMEPYAYLESEFDYWRRFISKIGEDDVEAIFWSGIGHFALYAETEIKNLKDGASKFFDNPTRDDWGSFFKDNFAHCWKIIEQLVVEGRDTKILQQLLQIIGSNRFYIMKKKGKVSLKPLFDMDDVASGSAYLKSFGQSFLKQGKLVALVDACLPDIDLKGSLGLDTEPYNWGDPLNTNASQLVICDTRKIGEIDFFKSTELQEKLKSVINQLSFFHRKTKVMIATQNSRMHDAIHIWQSQKKIPENAILTYYRSNISRGITVPNCRILVLIGAPYLPKEAYLPETYIETGHAKDMQSAYKKSDMKSAFVNLIGRVKDPKGEQLSIVYALGITASEVNALLAQEGITSPFVVYFRVQGADVEDFGRAAHLFLNVKRTRWNNLETDLPVVERIIRKSHDVDRIESAKVIPNQTKRVQEIANEYKDILKLYSVKVVTEANGLSFELTKK